MHEYKQSGPTGSCMITEQGDLGLGATPINETVEAGDLNNSKQDPERIDSE